jgi:hypothetical protein
LWHGLAVGLQIVDHLLYEALDGLEGLAISASQDRDGSWATVPTNEPSSADQATR